MIHELKSRCPQFVCWCFANGTEAAHNTQQRPFKGFGRPTKAKKEGGTGAKEVVDEFIENVGAPAVDISEEIVKKDISVSKTAKVGLQTAAVVLSVYSAANDLSDYWNNKISGAHLTVNLIMNGVGFLGPIGAGISLLYGFTESWWW